MDREAWWAVVYGVAISWTRISKLHTDTQTHTDTHTHTHNTVQRSSPFPTIRGILKGPPSYSAAHGLD